MRVALVLSVVFLALTNFAAAALSPLSFNGTFTGQALRKSSKKGVSLGDGWFLTATLASGQTLAGNVSFACTAANVAQQWWLCSGVTELAKGSVSFLGMFKNLAPQSQLAIIGGTGAYEAAQGIFACTPGAGPTFALQLSFA